MFAVHKIYLGLFYQKYTKGSNWYQILLQLKIICFLCEYMINCDPMIYHVIKAEFLIITPVFSVT